MRCPPDRHLVRVGCLAAALLVAGCTGAIGDDDDDAAPAADLVVDAPGADVTAPEPGPALGPAMPLRMLSRHEIVQTLEALFGDGAGAPALSLLVEPQEISGFDNNVLGQQVSEDAVAAQLALAEAVSAFVVERLALLAPCAQPGEANAARACARSFLIDELAGRAWRRPLEPAEVERILGYFEAGFADPPLPADPADAGAPYASGIELATIYVLMAPPFLYRLELGEPDAPDGTRRPLDGYELATRLSYFLWRTLPDDVLLGAAADQSLLTDRGLRAQLERMLDDPRADAMLGDFHARWLGYHRVEAMAKDLTAFPAWEAARPQLLGAAERLTAELVLRRQAGLEALFGSPLAFVHPDTAALFDLDPGALPPGDAAGFAPVDFTPGERLGLLTEPAFLAVSAGKPHFASAVQRGRLVRERLFCAPLDPPPSDLLQDVEALGVSADPQASQDPFAETLQRTACAGCHVQLNPVGYGLAAYDTFGRHRPLWHDGSPMRTAGALAGTDVDAPFADAAGFAARVAQSEMVRQCAIEHWFRYAHGVVEDEVAHARVLDGLRAALPTSQDPVRALIVSIATSDAFRHR